ncbi:hypothetical protein GOP47_0012097 [Adiantum capillus-veneris]|uniref:non-specific serine/threonine protein kinase n=1 Tax=Adiantum capillus-veneris TaxID=13818 RepID=A0A9D4UQB0_ADICA|nr:hypothetical protein GOP47_0012097 [Adiantum capillus-veneris]
MRRMNTAMGASFAALSLAALLICVPSPALAQAVTDPADISVLKSLSQKFNIEAWTFEDDPCGPKGQSIFVGYMKCVCTYNNGSTCHIVQLYMFGKNLRGTFPMDVFNLTYLTYLDFGQNFLDGLLPRELGNLTGLTHLAAGTNLLTGSIPLELGNLKSLTELYLDSNFLSGEIPMQLASLSKLSTLWLLDNNFSGPLPDIFSEMTSLTDMRLYGNNLQGPIPTSIQKLTNLKSLYVGELRNAGSFPVGLSNLKNLTTLSLRNNGLTGFIPSEIGNMSALNTIDLSFNALTGSIPSSLGNLPALISLYLGGNNLTGSIPKSLLQSSSLETLDLSYNQFDGSASLWSQEAKDMDLNPVWNSFNGSFQPFGTMSVLPLLDCASNIFCAHRTDESSGFAINVGGLAYSANMILYDADNQSTSVYAAPNNAWLKSSSGETKLLTAAGEIKGASDNFLFISARQAVSSLRYLGLAMRNGAYTIAIQFSEIGFGDDTVGRRLFDVYVQGTLVLKDFDIQKSANGSFRALALEFPTNVSNNVLDVHFFWAGKGTCCIPSGSPQDYGPLVSAIRVYSGSSFTEDGSSDSSKKTAIIVSACLGAAILLVICFFLILRRKWRWGRAANQAVDPSKEYISFEGAPMLYSYNEIRKATNNFHPDNKLGQGGFGSVYKGLLEDGSCIAIKELAAGSLQGKEEFMNEVTLISGVQHRNLVKLKGCCLDGGQPVLVYEYLENRSLDKILFESHGTIFLEWPTRFNIILGIARGLAYLHEESQTRIIHRDIKASNILLDVKLGPKIADFGLARLFVEDTSHVTTRIAGTQGYMAPEYAFRGKLTVKADVYSFGVLVLEIVSGRKNINIKASEEQEFLVDWAWNLCGQGHLLDLVDPRLKKEYQEDEMIRTIHVALLCVLPEAQTRPTITRAISMLLGDVKVSELPSKPNYWGESRRGTSASKDVSSSSASTSTTAQTTSSQSHSASSQSSVYTGLLTAR